MLFRCAVARRLGCAEQRGPLFQVANSRTDQARRVERARAFWMSSEDRYQKEIGKGFGIDPLKCYSLRTKALEFSPIAALDVKRSWRSSVITPKARAWVTSLAFQKPNELGLLPEGADDASLGTTHTGSSRGCRPCGCREHRHIGDFLSSFR